MRYAPHEKREGRLRRLERLGAGWPASSQQPAGQNPKSKMPKYWLIFIFKQITNNARSAPFLCVCAGVSLVNNISARKFSRRQIGGPDAQPLQAGVGERKWVGGGMVSGSRSLPSAGERLVVSTVTLCGAKPNSLTQLCSVVLPLLKITM
jgi:hypothetical protein